MKKNALHDHNLTSTEKKLFNPDTQLSFDDFDENYYCMIQKFLCISFLLVISLSTNAQIFTQNFDTSTSVLDYMSGTPNIGEFTEISNSSKTPTSITAGALRFQKKDVISSYFYRNPNPPLTPTPTFIQMKFDFEVTNNDQNHPDNRREIPFYFGPNFGKAGTSIKDVHSRFGLGISATSGNFFLKILDNGSSKSSDFSGKQTITFVVNNSGASQSYKAPDASTETIANDTWEVWVGATKVFNDIVSKNGDLDLGSFKFQYNSFLPNATLDFDNFEMKDFLTNSTPTPDTQSLVHPHIWASNSDREKILKNIEEHNWASSLFNQLKRRHAARKANHPTNPMEEIALIPSIPGDRTQHRTLLNVGAECAILYYLTEEDVYAQIAADILHQYVTMLSTQDPLTFEWYTTNFNHLTQTRELFTRVGIMYDFVQPYISKSGTTVYDITSNSQKAFDFDLSQKAFEVMAENVLRVGGLGSNHSVLELPGALYNVLCMENDAVRESYFDRLWNGDSKQDGIKWMIDNFTEEEGLWPESAGYSKFTQALFIQLMNVIDRYKPDLNIVTNNQKILEGIFIYENQKYPNGAVMAYGDIGRQFNDHGYIFRNVIALADRKGLNALKNRAATTLQKLYTEQGGYNPQIINQRLEWNNPLELLWGVPIDPSISPLGEPQYSTVKTTHAGIIMQRNYVESNNEDNGLMYYTGGGTYVHAHATGIDMELYGAGYVIGPDYGADNFGSDIHEQYAVSHAAHNTIIVNGATKRGPKTNGNSTWQNIVAPITLEASEPKAYAKSIADNFSFSTQFLDDTINDLEQQRTNSIVRTSPTSGYYIDIFRSISKKENTYHDYLFHGLGDAMQIKTGTDLLPLVDTPKRFQNDTGDTRKQPGWRWFSKAKTSAATTDPITARFHVAFDNKYLHVSVPGGIEKEYSAALAPPTKQVRNGYDKKDTQLFVMRKYGEAWDEPFIAIYEPSSNAKSTIKSTEYLYTNTKVVGVKVVSTVNEEEITDLILSNERPEESIALPELHTTFTGRFAIIRTKMSKAMDQTEVSLYIGDGQQLVFNGRTLDADQGKAYLEYRLDTQVLSVPEHSDKNDFVTLYPNPTTDKLEIRLPRQAEQFQITLHSIYGQLVQSEIVSATNGKVHLDLSHHANGIYFVKLNLDKPIFLKLVKE